MDVGGWMSWGAQKMGWQQNPEINATKEKLSHLVSSESSIPDETVLFEAQQKGVDYGIYRTASGLVIQKANDHADSKRTGYYLGSNGETKFDGDQNCLQVAREFLSFEDRLKSVAAKILQDKQPPQLDPPFRFYKEKIQYSQDTVVQGLAVQSTQDNNHRMFIHPSKGILELKDDDDYKMLANVIKNLPVSIGSTKIDPEKMRANCKLFFNCYNRGYTPSTNMSCLLGYCASPAFEADAKSVKVYFNGKQLHIKDAVQIAHRREPVNIGMSQKYDQEAFYGFIGQLQKEGKGVIPHRVSAYNDPAIVKENGTRFEELPNSIAIYSETPLWKKPGEESSRIHVACLSIPAPPLDTAEQPHYNYYVKDGKLDEEKYREEMRFLAKTVVQSVVDHKESAFDGAGLKRAVISKYGQQAFLQMLTEDDKEIAHQIFYDSLIEAISTRRQELQGVKICLSEFSEWGNATITEKFVNKLQGIVDVSIVNGDILANAKEGDLIVNAWDQHSFPGNGNEGDRSFDGRMGTGTAIPVLQNALFNLNLESAEDGLPLSPDHWTAT